VVVSVGWNGACIVGWELGGVRGDKNKWVG